MCRQPTNVTHHFLITQSSLLITGRPVCRASCIDYVNAYNTLVEQDCHALGDSTFPSIDLDATCGSLPTTACVIGAASTPQVHLWWLLMIGPLML